MGLRDRSLSVGDAMLHMIPSVWTSVSQTAQSEYTVNRLNHIY